MSRQPTSPRVHELIRSAARMALNPPPEWLEEFDRITLAACPELARDPALAKVVSRANRGNLAHFASAILRNPDAPVPANLSPETLDMARDLVRRGMDASALEVYRIGHNLAWRRWTEIAFRLTSHPEELQGLLDIPFRHANEFVDATLAGITEEMHAEYAKLARDIDAERRKIVEQILHEAPVNEDRVQTQLDYSFDRVHTAAIIWCPEPANYDPDPLGAVAEAFGKAAGGQRPLNIIAGAATRWVWVKDAADLKALDVEQLHEILDAAPGSQIAIGTSGAGIEGFRRSHMAALATQRMLTRLRSPHRAAFFADVQMIALLTENPEGADNFIRSTLGNFEKANPTLHTTVLTYINAACNASRAAKLLYTHRNTLLHRLDTAQRLLPRPLNETTVEVAVAIQALRWRGEQASGSTTAPKAMSNGGRAAVSGQ
ncbi:Rv1453 family transcriptional regulator [Mycobacterium bourgelatii]|nr:PucR family transcriptional regulator [Mycobacterium bourgelatii]MCV6973062.1 PucR family transcriptional regulator [Mycobacterium bourgelatii]